MPKTDCTESTPYQDLTLVRRVTTSTVECAGAEQMFSRSACCHRCLRRCRHVLLIYEFWPYFVALPLSMAMAGRRALSVGSAVCRMASVGLAMLRQARPSPGEGHCGTVQAVASK